MRGFTQPGYAGVGRSLHPAGGFQKSHFLLKCWKAHAILETAFIKMLDTQHTVEYRLDGLGSGIAGKDADSNVCVLLNGSPVCTIVGSRKIMTGFVPSPRWICTLALAAVTKISQCFPHINGLSTNVAASGWPVLLPATPGEPRMLPSLTFVVSTPRVSSPRGRREKETEVLHLLINHNRK